MTDLPWESGEDGTTPLSPEDLEHLIPKHITLRRELNEAEAADGNGRLSRLMGDLLVVAQGRDRFSWGAGSLNENARQLYLEAIRAGDNGDFEALLVFARTP